MATMARETLIGIDTGGTFTDVVRQDGRRRVTAKVPSTPDDPARAVLAGLEAVGGLPRGGRLRHGSTVGTNAVLTRTGARVVFVVTAGFEDVLHLGRGQRDDLHAFDPRRTEPLVAREHCVGVDERMGADGRPVRRLSRRTVDEAVRATLRLRPEAVVVCLLHSVREPRHEREISRALERALEGTGVSVHASARVSADGREAERAATAVLDAYVAPKVVDYVKRIARATPRGALTVMRSDGGRMSLREVRRAPVRTLLSGPAGGVAAAHALARRLGFGRVLSFDVGGTSTDVAWLEGDDLPVESELRIGRFCASVPSLALETVGAGGGSLVMLDAGGALRVGPRSAGADPGPACYGLGGPFTLTDAWLLLDRLPEALLAGGFPLDRAAAERAGRPIARSAGCSLRALAEGVAGVAAATTARALRRASVARGHDPRGAVLVAFGGAGPMLGAATAEHLGLASVVVPVDPGTFAAEGTLVAPLRADVTEAVTGDDGASFERLRAKLADAVRVRLERQGARHVRLAVEVDARYEGQAFEVTVPHGGGWRQAFHAEHARRYGFADRARRVEVVRLRVRGAGFDAPVRHPRRRAKASAGRLDGIRRQGPGPAALSRADLTAGDGVVGPARVEEFTGTTFVPPGWRAFVGDEMDLVLERER